MMREDCETAMKAEPAPRLRVQLVTLGSHRVASITGAACAESSERGDLVALTVDQIVELYRRRGARRYGGEAVSQLEHALQCAALAMQEDAPPALVAAALLHDFGHLVAELPPGAAGELEDAHEYLAIPFLRGTFPASVIEPIRLHVGAKRFLCRVERDYAQTLSPASRRSLALQGGIFNDIEAERFLARPWAWDALRLRRWDDRAKVPGMRTPSLPDLAGVLCAATVPETEPAPLEA
jgi:phosphonate degradation associated HDIG domain protein